MNTPDLNAPGARPVENPPRIRHNSDSKLALMLGKGLIRLLSPGGPAGLSIFIYHRVLPHKDPLFPAEVDAVDFDTDLQRLRSLFNVIPLIEAVRHCAAGTLPPRAACITFDDGYADNADVALPILLRHQLHATFFVATGFLDGGRMWNDSVIELVRGAPSGVLDFSAHGLGNYEVTSVDQRRAAIASLIGKLKYLPLDERLEQVKRLIDTAKVALPDDLMMTSDQVRRLHEAGMGIGGHTVNHPILTSVTPQEARCEIAEGKLALEAIVGAPIRLFAYPNGKPNADYGAEHVKMVKELGFEGAVSTAWGACKNTPDVFQLPRFSPWDRTPMRFAARMARNLTIPADLT